MHLKSVTVALQSSTRHNSDQSPLIHRPPNGYLHTALHTGLSFLIIHLHSASECSLQKLHLHSFIPHLCSILGPSSPSLPPPPLSPITTAPYPQLYCPIHPKTGHFTLPFTTSFSFLRSEAFSLFPKSFMHDLSILVFGPSHCTYVFLVSNLRSLTNFVLLEPSLSSFLLLSQ